MTKEKTEALKRCVLDQSVHNAVSQRGDQPVGSIVTTLHALWDPRWAPVAKVVTAKSVAESVQRLERCGLVEVDGEQVKILVRDPATRRGRVAGVNYEKATLVIGQNMYARQTVDSH